ncbi:hypothetical protein [Acidocella aminolytica]|uniref:Uncharacterized protein n=1 Tax=Acidocella aminolytica 101 = DSM 11237 TaxID=1120923 RepID=A0A0D6PG61_9PROT|nr:hypothetical protein [Acidocella aminolytica]GAN79834.1 hypothetical protein Aam_030_067 [Acidocella aminolytica 101 = DSM 11237]GBQ31984.1 hypothetical protein AA11237_0033 [Acidocella aminolytica 101 = DSM 11237]SHF36009.1 hypothetical protein SAMN02746095_02967 [Acidocella aminolytica 101 = DSM 11237]
MATGDQSDMVTRLKALLPLGWFGSKTIILDGLLNGLAYVWAWVFSLTEWAFSQLRLSTMSGSFLDIFAVDYLGPNFLRKSNETDPAFRSRIYGALVPPTGTRASLIAAIFKLTGRKPEVFEPRNPSDTGGYGSLSTPAWTGLAYGVAGGYGSLNLPYQAFVTAYRPLSQGMPLMAGYQPADVLSTSTIYAPLGYGVGLGSYVDYSQAFDAATDSDIYAAIAAAKPAASIMWTRIKS